MELVSQAVGTFSRDIAILNSQKEIDYSSYELGAILLKLRDDLYFRSQTFAGEECFVIEDPTSSHFFRVGEMEHRFMLMLDGKTSITDAVAYCATMAEADSYTETQAAALCRWLVENSLATTSQSESAERLLKKQDGNTKRQRKERLNPISLKIPLGSPDRLVQKLTPFLSWFFSGLGISLWLVVCTVGAYTLFAEWDNIVQTNPVADSANWVWLAVTGLLLKLIHEVSHAVACRRFGGETREAGILLLLFVPLPYVDVTSSWRFASRWQRIFVSAAGMYTEILIAALASIIWASTDSSLVQHHAVNVMVTAGFVTVLFNLNPLMRFDGYYIVSDILELPNLGTHGQQDFMYLVNRLFFGSQSSAPSWPEGRSLLIRMYGVASFIWRILICVSLTLAAESLYFGAGIVLAIMAVVLWVVIPIFKLIRFLVSGDAVSPPNRIRFLTVCCVLFSCLWGIWTYVPYVERLNFAAVIEHDPVTTVRSATSGFVDKIEVSSGQFVREGQVLVRLRNSELRARITELELAIQQSQLRATQLHQEGLVAAFQVELENQIALEKRHKELALQSSELVIVSPSDGTILTRKLEALRDRWLKAGSSVCLVGDPSSRTVQLLIPQADINIARSAIDQTLDVHVWGQPKNFSGRLVDIESRGRSDLSFPALSAQAGGPLAVRAVTDRQSQETKWQLLQPHFIARIQLPEAVNQSLGTGQTGTATLMRSRGSIGKVMTRAAYDYLRRRNHQTL